MSPPPPEPTAADDPGTIGRVSHGYAPDGAPQRPDLVPLATIVRDTADHIATTARSEIDLLRARGALAGYGVKWASIWGLVAASCLTVALLALAFGAILFLTQLVGPLLATLIVVLFLLAAAAVAAYQARINLRDVAAAMKVHPPSHSQDPVEP